MTILPRGRSLGHTLVLPLEDRYTQTRAEILDQLVYALGGRAAEELVFHEPTTGASNDIEKATGLARAMVTEYGMSAKLGAVKYGTGDAEPFMGRDYGHQRDYSEDIAADIDGEVRDLIERAHDEAWEILVQYRDALDAMVLELVEKETLTKDDLERILGSVRKRPPHNSFAGFGKRTPSDKGPIDIPVHLTKNGAHANGSSNGSPTGRRSPASRRPDAARAAGPVAATGFVRPAGAGRSDLRAVSDEPVDPAGGVDLARAEKAVRELLVADRRGSRPRRAARDAGSRGACLRRGVRRAVRRPGRGPADDLRREPRRARPGQGHPDLLDLRAPPRAVARHRRGRLHPGRGRADHRAVEARPRGRPVRPAAAGAGAADLAGGRRRDAPARSRAA